ncbi:hypothetical protein ACP4OV_013518 [Aristida adscensionis]
MTGHCAPACHCACSSSAFVPVMSNPSLFSTSSASSGGGWRPPPSVAAPLLMPKVRPDAAAGHEDDDSAECDLRVWLGVGLAGLVVAAFVLVIIFARPHGNNF